MKRAAHTILNHVDTPLKILIWTKGELLVLGPLIFGIVVNEFLVGLGVTGLGIWGTRFFKRCFGKGQLQAVMYWYLPPSSRSKGLPRSCIREYQG